MQAFYDGFPERAPCRFVITAFFADTVRIQDQCAVRFRYSLLQPFGYFLAERSPCLPIVIRLSLYCRNCVSYYFRKRIPYAGIALYSFSDRLYKFLAFLPELRCFYIVRSICYLSLYLFRHCLIDAVQTFFDIFFDALPDRSIACDCIGIILQF